MTERELKKMLLKIREDNFSYGSYDELLIEMIKFIGVPDPELRDFLIYETLDFWISEGMIPPERQEDILYLLLENNFLFYRIGESGTNSVFTRSFSVLIIASILQRNNAFPFLDDCAISYTCEKLIEYGKNERDFRGYTDETGWAHSTAHFSDAVAAIAASPYVSLAMLKNLLSVLKERVCQGEQVYIDREPERISAAVRAIISRKLIPEHELVLWLEGFQGAPADIDDIESWHRMINIQNFYKAIYFALGLGRKTGSELAAALCRLINII